MKMKRIQRRIVRKALHGLNIQEESLAITVENRALMAVGPNQMDVNQNIMVNDLSTLGDEVKGMDRMNVLNTMATLLITMATTHITMATILITMAMTHITMATTHITMETIPCRIMDVVTTAEGITGGNEITTNS
jgi:hypothetical protein